MRDDLHMTCFLDVIRPGLRSAVAARLCFPPRCSAVVLGLSAALSGHYNMICNGDSDNRKKIYLPLVIIGLQWMENFKT